MRRVRAAMPRIAPALAAVLLTAGCGLTHVTDLNFRLDDRLHFLGPQSRSTVHLPFTVSWRMEDFRPVALGSEPPSDGAGVFGVFVDRAPIKPGETLRSVAHGDTVCERDPKCPDEHYLNQHKVYTTTRSSIRIVLMPSLPGREKLQLHTVTVILIDTSGRRIGESAWELDVRMPRFGV